MNFQDKNLLIRTRERLYSTISHIKWSGSHDKSYVIINEQGYVLSDQTGSWTLDIAEARNVNSDQDPGLVGGTAVHTLNEARDIVLAKLRAELKALEVKLFCSQAK